MITVSETAIQAALRDIRNGVEYPDFWTNRYEDTDQDEQAEEKPKEEKEKAAKA
jgi:hypothetical protein